jgi:hypothetical protein
MIDQPAFRRIYILGRPALEDGPPAALLRAVGLEGGTREFLPGGDGMRVRRDSRSLEMNSDGEIWFEDAAKLWNPSTPDGLLPPRSRAEAMALALFDEINLMPRTNNVATISAPVVVNSGTRTAVARPNASGGYEHEDCHTIDAYVALGPRIHIPGTGESPPAVVEVIGRGGKVGVVYGTGSQIIGLNASWRPIVVSELAPALEPHPEDLPSAGQTPLIVDRENIQLVYRATVLADGRHALCPYWIFRVFFLDDEGYRRRSWDVTAPAARFDLPRKFIAFPDHPPRTEQDRPNEGPGYAVGASWKTGGNSAATTHAQNLLMQATAEKWNVRFAWRDRDAWESDWSANAADWADAVDLAYYAGHAYDGGWKLTDPKTGDDRFLFRRTVADLDPDRLLLGRQRLKWILVGACGPLQDECATGGSENVFKWSGAFDGLRLIAGFASTVSGFTDEGARAFKLAREGVPLARAWLRAARQAQPIGYDGASQAQAASRWAALLAIESDGGSALDDCLPGHGPALADVSGPIRFRGLWAPA